MLFCLTISTHFRSPYLASVCLANMWLNLFVAVPKRAPLNSHRPDHLSPIGSTQDGAAAARALPIVLLCAGDGSYFAPFHIEVSDALVKSFVGYYGAPSLTLTVECENCTLTLQRAAGCCILLSPSPTQSKPKCRDHTFSFVCHVVLLHVL